MMIANIVPIYKSGDNTLFDNYRPVSVLPSFSKILERIVYNRPIELLNKHSVLYDYQFGFRKLYSTPMALITLIDKLSNALDGEVRLLESSLTAFDTIDHDILLLKLEYYRVRGPKQQISVCNVQWDQIISISGNMWSSPGFNPGASSIFYLREWPTQINKNAFLLLFAEKLKMTYNT